MNGLQECLCMQYSLKISPLYLWIAFNFGGKGHGFSSKDFRAVVLSLGEIQGRALDEVAGVDGIDDVVLQALLQGGKYRGGGLEFALNGGMVAHGLFKEPRCFILRFAGTRRVVKFDSQLARLQVASP